MLTIIIALLVLLWLLGFGVFHVTSLLIHVLLVAAVIVLLVDLINGRRTL